MNKLYNMTLLYTIRNQYIRHKITYNILYYQTVSFSMMRYRDAYLAEQFNTGIRLK